jgi:type I restriction enzyme M protein
LLYLVTEKFTTIDLHPDRVSNADMGTIFEGLIRKFAELSNETAGEHFTPREVIRLMVNLIFAEDDEVLSNPNVVRTVYDPTAGTGGMLSVAGEWLHEHNPKARLTVSGQELNDESYAICKADMLIKGQDVSAIKPGDTLADDGHAHEVFDYMLSNPPFGVEWKQSEKAVRKEHENEGYNGRFGPGLPRISDGSLLFMLHLVKKMRPTVDGGARFCIVQNGSPLFTGGAGSGESEIRRYLLENDLVEAIVALPTEMFYNTGISTYLWVVTNHKLPARRGKLQLIDASGFWQRMRKSLGSKRKELSPEHINEITRLFCEFKDVRHAPEDGKGPSVPISLIFPNESFGYRTAMRRQLRMPTRRWSCYDCSSATWVPYARFAWHLLTDQAAGATALQLPWNNATVEEQIHRLKLLKRQMYGGAAFDLLRLRDSTRPKFAPRTQSRPHATYSPKECQNPDGAQSDTHTRYRERSLAQLHSAKPYEGSN